MTGDYSNIKHFEYTTPENSQRHFRYVCIYRSSYEKLKDKITHIHYIDIEDIMPHKAFETITHLARILGFSKPKESDRSFYETKLYGIESIMFPLTLNFANLFNADNALKQQDYKHNIGGGGMYSLYLSNTLRADYFLGFDAYKDVSDFFHFSVPDSRIKIYIKAHTQPILAQLSTDQITHLNQALYAYYEWILEQSAHMQKCKITEEDVLKYLANDQELSYKLANALEYETSLIKEQAPEIYRSWKYYHAFLQSLQQGELHARD